MKRTYAWRDGELVELTPEAVSELHYIQPDLAEFQSPDGARIGGRAQWKEHLKVTGSIEMGHADIQAQSEKWEQKKAKNRERLSRNTGDVRPAVIPEDVQPTERSRLSAEMLNRLDGRPVPDRKTLIQLTRETAIALRRRR